MRTGTDSRANSRGQLLALGITKNLVEHGSSVHHDRVEGPVAVSRGEAPKVGLLTLRRRRSSDTICDGARSHLRLLFRVLAVEAEPVSPSRPRGLPTPLRLVGATLARPKPAAAHVFPGPETNQQGTLIQQPRRRRQLFSQPNLHRRRRRAIAAVTTSIASCIAAVAVALALVVVVVVHVKVFLEEEHVVRGEQFQGMVKRASNGEPVGARSPHFLAHNSSLGFVVVVVTDALSNAVTAAAAAAAASVAVDDVSRLHDLEPKVLCQSHFRHQRLT
mmetsp:Transcript_54461/g.101841  ORF Transcript_54461/g.101841 Transcript_54461/m.101841 type:complete len:275 (-) Transcript_54461:1600-2424(-)